MLRSNLMQRVFFNHIIIIVYSMRGWHSYFKIKVKQMQHKIKTKQADQFRTLEKTIALKML